MDKLERKGLGGIRKESNESDKKYVSFAEDNAKLGADEGMWLGANEREWFIKD